MGGHSKKWLYMTQKPDTEAASDLISGSQPPELLEMHFCCLKATRFAAFQYSSLSQQRQNCYQEVGWYYETNT